VETHFIGTGSCEANGPTTQLNTKWAARRTAHWPADGKPLVIFVLLGHTRAARVSKTKIKLVFWIFDRILVRDVFHWIRVAETSNLRVCLRLYRPWWSVSCPNSHFGNLYKICSISERDRALTGTSRKQLLNNRGPPPRF